MAAPFENPLTGGEGDVRLVVRDDLVDLVGEHDDIGVAAQNGGDALERGARDDGARRVGGVAEHEHARGGRDGRLERGGLQAVAMLRARLHDHRPHAAQLRNADVRRPVGRGQHELVARIAEGKHGLQDGLLGAVAAQHLLRRIAQPLALEQVLANRGAKLVRACERRVLHLALVERLMRGGHDGGRWREVGLAYGEREHRLALALELDCEV
eukprot:scaffold23969_cov26-Tisochrysis_lutea.AAC.3